jgi:hypothetical protein
VVAIKVFGTVMTVSPDCTPAAIRAKPQRVCAAPYSDAMLHVTKLRELLFELFDDFPADKL